MVGGPGTVSECAIGHGRHLPALLPQVVRPSPLARGVTGAATSRSPSRPALTGTSWPPREGHLILDFLKKMNTFTVIKKDGGYVEQEFESG